MCEMASHHRGDTKRLISTSEYAYSASVSLHVISETKNPTGDVIQTRLQDIKHHHLKQPPTSLNFNPAICALSSSNNPWASSITTDLLQLLWRSPSTSLLWAVRPYIYQKSQSERWAQTDSNSLMLVISHNKNCNELERSWNVKLDLITRNDV